MRAFNLFIAASALLLTGAAPSPQSLSEALADARSTLELSNGQLTGPGAEVLRDALSNARYVAVGEDHFTNEVPAFVAALCDTMAPEGLAALALEIGPTAAASISSILQSPDRLEQMRRFTARYPNAVAFLDGQADNDAAAHCQRAVPGRRVAILGLDQEYIGSAGLLLDHMLAERLSAPARKEVLALREEERHDAAAAARSGDPQLLLLTSITPARLDEVAAALKYGASPETRRLFGEFAESAAIYRLNAQGSPEANTRRATLLKRHLASQLPAKGKLILKFGDWHLYRGANPLGNFDLGNYVTELADSRGERSLHILVLGARGVHATFAGYAKPPGRAPFVMIEDPDYTWLKIAIDQQLPNGWTLFDLRRLRHRRLADLDSDWVRVLAGYDFLLLVPNLTPSDSFVR